jgi:ribose 1,5-bisphosphokinase
VTRPGLFVAIVGPSGVGKDSLIRAVAALFAGDPDFFQVRRVITRASDANEEHDTLDLAAFEAAARAACFALTWGAHGLYYGVPVEADAAIAAGKVVIANLSRGAVGEARRRWRDVLAVSVTAKPATLAARLAERGRESAEGRRERLNRSLQESFSFEPDAVIDNDGPLEKAAQKLADLIKTRRAQT